MNTKAFITVSVFAISLAAHSADRGGAPYQLQTKSRFEVKTGAIKDVEGATLTTTVILTERHEISFLPLNGFLMSVQEKQQRVSFTSPTNQTYLTVSSLSRYPSNEEFDRVIAQAYPEGTTTLTGPVVSAVGTGQFRDIVRTFPNRVQLITRHAYIPIDRGAIEVVLTAEAGSFEQRSGLFTRTINSLKVEPRQLTE